MFGDIRVHRMDKAEIIHDLSYLRENIADPLSALAVLLKPKIGRRESTLGVTERLAIYELRPLTSISGKGRLVVKGVDLRWTARHEELNDVLRSRSKVRSLRGEGTRLCSCCGGSAGDSRAGLLEGSCETKSAEPRAHLTESLAAGELAIMQGCESLAVSGFVFLKFH